MPTTPIHKHNNTDAYTKQTYRDTWEPYRSITPPEQRAKLASLWDHRLDRDYTASQLAHMDHEEIKG